MNETSLTIPRIVAAETLDALAEDDPAAQRSRRDLRRVHLIMGTRSILRQALHDLVDSRELKYPLQVLELGAGDGSLMLGVAQTLVPIWSQVELTLLDRQNLIEKDTIAKYAEIGWAVVSQVIDVLDWASGTTDSILKDTSTKWDLIVVNLFLHHFEHKQLESLLDAISKRTNLFFACEPKRAWLPLIGSHLIGAIGANKVTREDAVLSVHAGFRGAELAALWPSHSVEWRLKEYSANLFSHCFSAERLELI